MSSTEYRRDKVLAALTGIVDGLAELLGIAELDRGQKVIYRELFHLRRNQEIMMADFTEFNAKLDENAQALADAQARIEEDVQALEDKIADLELDAADQAQVDAAVDKLRASTDVLRGIDPLKSADVPTNTGGGTDVPAGDTPAEPPAEPTA